MLMGWHSASELRTPTDLLYIPHMVNEHKSRWNYTNRGKTKASGKTRPSATLSIINSTCTDPDANTASAMTARRLTTWATARPNTVVISQSLSYQVSQTIYLSVSKSRRCPRDLQYVINLMQDAIMAPAKCDNAYQKLRPCKLPNIWPTM